MNVFQALLFTDFLVGACYCWHLLNMRGNFEIEYIAPGFKLRDLNFEKCFWHLLFFLVAYFMLVL